MAVVRLSQSRILSGNVSGILCLRGTLLLISGLLLLFGATSASARPPWASDAPCNPYCSAPPTPTQPSAPSQDSDGNYTVSVYEGTGPATYGWIEWNTGEYSNPTSGTTAILTVSNKPTGAYVYRAKACLGNNGGEVCSGWSVSTTVYVLRTPGSPTLGNASADACAGSLAVGWSAGTGYPTGSTIYYDLQESINGGGWVTRLADSSLNQWSRNAAELDTYQYRVRSRYYWNGYYSDYSAWASNSTFVMPACADDSPIPQPPEPPSDPVGSIEGAFSVLPSGAASYNVPLEVPPGIGGMAPKLSLNYNSQSGNGFVGVGWSLEGLSVITHCPAILDTDGFFKGVDFKGVNYCLDDRRLVKVPNTLDEYRTEIDGFNKIIAVGNTGNGTPLSFIVRTPTGEEMLYGTRADSRIEPQGRPSDVMVWALNTITDSSGNKMEFYYTEDSTKSEFVPLRIEYAFAGSVSRARIEFGYGTQSSPILYIGGSQIRTTQLLQTVTTYAAGQAVKEYRLNYETAPGSNRKRLKDLTECSLVSGTVCLNPTVFTWQGSRNSPTETNMGSRSSGHNISFFGMHWPIDVDGDGEQELVYNRFGTYEFWYVGSTVESSSGYANWGNKQHEVADANAHWVMDVNGDGLNDLVYRRNLANKEYWAMLNKGNGDIQFEQWAVADHDGSGGWPLDVNNDGRMDLIYVRAGTQDYHALIAQNSGILADDDYLGSRPNHQVGLDGAHWVMDINSDARPDLVYVEAGTRKYHAMINGGLAFSWHNTWITRSYDAAYGYANWPIDVNGDGLIDLVYCNVSSASNREYRVLLNKGDRTAADQSWIIRPHDTLRHGGKHWIADTNADGVMDLLYKPSTTAVWSLESRPDGSRVAVSWGNLASNDGSDPDHLLEIDASGDGLPDLVNASRSNVQYKMLRNNSRPDLLLSIRDGYDNLTSIQYKPLTDDSVYERVENQFGKYPNTPIKVPMNVVSKVTIPDGIGGLRNTEYFYRKMKINQHGRGILGFEEVISTDVEADIRVETKYEQLFPKTGLVASSVRCRDTGGACQEPNVLQRTVNSYGEQITVDGTGINGTSSADAKFVYPLQTIETMYALDNSSGLTSPLGEITTTNSILDPSGIPDPYGNIRAITVDTRSLVNTQRYKTTTVNEYANRTTGNAWRLGLLTSSTVTKYLNGGTTTDANSVRKTAFEYDTVTHLLKKEIMEPDRIEPFKRVTIYERDGYGNITRATSCATDFNNCAVGAAGPSSLPFRTVTTVYDSFGQFPQTVTNAEGEGESYVYDRKFGNKLSLTGPNSLTTNWLYDGFGKPIKETRADTARTVTTYKWCAGDCPQYGSFYVVTQSTGNSPVTEYFDAQGRKLRTRAVGFDGRNIHTDTVYNILGQPAQVSEPYFEDDINVYWTQSQYDLIGRVVSVTPPLGPVVNTDYDLLTVTMSRIANSVLRTESEVKNIIGQTVSVTNPAGTTLLYTYDSQGNLKTTMTQGFSNTLITVTHDLLGRKTQTIDPDMGTWNYQYNGYGDLVSQTNALSQTVTMKYDRLGRLTERDEPEGTSIWDYGDSSTYTSSNRNIGKLVSVSGPDGLSTKNIDYDSLGRPSQTTTLINIAPYASESYVTGQTYDTAGRVKTVLYPDVGGSRFQVKHHYNPHGYLSKVTSTGGTIVYWRAQEMNARGQLELALLGNGASVMNTYQPETGLLDGIMVDATNLIYHMSYEIDEVGNIESRTDHRQSLTENFQYDILDQLTNSNINGGNAKSYTYDALGNITSKTGVGSYTYGTCGAGPHAVCQAGAATYTYDANGNMESTTAGHAVLYKSFNLPHEFKQGTTTVARFQYDAQRTRVFRSTASSYTAYVGMTDTGNALYEHEVQGTTEKHLHFIYAGGQAFAVHTIQTGSSPLTKTEYLHRDHLGSVEAVSNASGVAIAYYSHDAWGKQRNTNWTDTTGSKPTPAGRLGFTGHEMIPEVGLIHMNGRVYDPLLGKFLSADPMVQFEKDVRSYNRYAYVSNNPLKYTDPTGFLRGRVEKWFKKHFGTILNVVSIFYPGLRPFAAAYGMLNAAYYGAGPGQIAVSAFAGYVGGELGRYVAGVSQTAASMLFHQAVISGAVSGAFSGGISTMITGGKLSRGILQGMATGAVTASIAWKVSQSSAEAVNEDAGKDDYMVSAHAGGSPIDDNYRVDNITGPLRDTPEEAVDDFARYAEANPVIRRQSHPTNGNIHRLHREMGTRIRAMTLLDGSVKYFYDKIYIGGVDFVNVGLTKDSYAYVHTHPADFASFIDARNASFSPEDFVNFTNIRQKMPGLRAYLIAADGAGLRYDSPTAMPVQFKPPGTYHP